MVEELKQKEEKTVQGGPEQQTLFPDVDNSDAAKEEVKPDERDERITTLEANIQEGKDREKRMEAMLQTSLNQNKPQVEIPPVIPVDIPDPISDPEGYQVHIAEQTKNIVDQGVNEIRTETQKNNAYNSMWTEFSEKNPELAKEHIGLVKFHATEALREVAAKGQDPQQYLLSNKQIFLDDIAQRTNTMIAKIKGNSEPDGRTEGIFPNSPRAQIKSEDQQNEKVSTFFKELVDVQEKLGVF